MKFSSTAWKESRRLQALALQKKGWKQTEIAEALGVTDGAVSQWFRMVDDEGATSLLRSRATGQFVWIGCGQIVWSSTSFRTPPVNLAEIAPITTK